ncbi:MAG: LysM peptidoglycan-binding domain-containing protein [Nitrospirae bacterium]|nr:LysM peptidoglycan-binding domain-containing protein [Nitrospirota bacterium]
MRYKGVLLGFFLALLVLPSIAVAESHEDKEYKVIKGDTLWGISGKELNDSFLWPKIWKENPGITNPDKVYPGQTIKIPLYLLQKEKREEPAVVQKAPEMAPPAVVTQVTETPAPKQPEPAPLKPLVGRNALIASGYIADSVKGIGRVDGSPSDRSLFGNNDIIYIKTELPVSIGDKFYILRVGPLVTHPVTGKAAGYLVETRGIAEVIKFENGATKARISEMFDDIQVNDLLEAYYQLPPALAPAVPRKPDINGTVLTSRSLRLVSGNLDIVYIDKGSLDGIETGDVLQTLRIGSHKVPNSIIQIISTNAVVKAE